MMDVEPAKRFGRVLDLGDKAVHAGDGPGIARLAAAFAVEGRLVGEDGDRIALARRFDARAILDQCDDLTFAGFAQIAGELRRALALGNIEPDVFRRLLSRPLPRGARGRFLRSHGLIEPARSTPNPWARSASSVKS